jgi:hypothetical protein
VSKFEAAPQKTKPASKDAGFVFVSGGLIAAWLISEITDSD